MPRTTIAPITVKGPYPTLPVAANSLDVTATAADIANLNQAAFGSHSKLVIIARNSGVAPFTVTITSAPGIQGRTGDVTAYSLAAGEILAFVVERSGWVQSDGYVYFQASDAAVLFTVLGL